MSAPQPEEPLPQALHIGRAAVVYGIAAFAIGFVFGVIRELALLPLAGRRMAHAIEFPFVTLAVCIAAWRIVLWREAWSAKALALWGVCGTLVLIALESIFALYVVGVPLAAYLEGYNVAQGALFPFGLAIMIAAPFVIGKLLRRTGA